MSNTVAVIRGSVSSKHTYARKRYMLPEHKILLAENAKGATSRRFRRAQQLTPVRAFMPIADNEDDRRGDS
jgi:hypothetical protein